MKEIRNDFGDLVAYEIEMHMTNAEAGPGDESRVTLESKDCSMPYSGERLVMDMPDEEVRRNFGGEFTVTVAPIEECVPVACEPEQRVPAFADLCAGNAAEVVVASCDDLKAAWNVGDELSMHLKASADGRQPEQDVVWAVMGFDCKDMMRGQKSRAVVGLKDGLEEPMTHDDAMEWLNSEDGFASMLPGWFTDLFGVTANSMPHDVYADTFWLPSETEVFGCTQCSDGELEEVESQLPYYAGRRDRRVKHRGIVGSAGGWWERSPYSDSSSYFCTVFSDGSAYWNYASNTRLLAPAGCF